MNSHRRLWFVKGFAVVATAVTLGATINPTTAAGNSPSVQRATTLVTLSAQSMPLAVPVDAPALLTDWVRRVVVPPSLGAPVPAPQFPPMVAPTSIGTSIKGIYNAVEPWVRYGFDLAAYAVGWVPYIGWLAPQITIFYNFGERIARSITFNIADLLDGQVTFVQGLTNVGVDTFYSFVQLGIDQWNFWLPSLPPLPPLPFSLSTPPASSTIEPLTAPVDRATVAATNEGNARPRTATDDPVNVDMRDSASTNESKKTTGLSGTAAAKLPRAERTDAANRKPTAAGTQRDSLKTNSVKADAPKNDGPKDNGPKDRVRNGK